MDRNGEKPFWHRDKLGQEESRSRAYFLLEFKSRQYWGSLMLRQCLAGDIYFEEAVLSTIRPSLVLRQRTITAACLYWRRGCHWSFWKLTRGFLTQTAESGLDALMDFLADPEAAEFEMAWNAEAFENGKRIWLRQIFIPYQVLRRWWQMRRRTRFCCTNEWSFWLQDCSVMISYWLSCETIFAANMAKELQAVAARVRRRLLNASNERFWRKAVYEA